MFLSLYFPPGRDTAIVLRLCYDPIVTYTESPPPVLVGPLVGVNILVVSSGLQVSRARTRRTTAAAKEPCVGAPGTEIENFSDLRNQRIGKEG